MTDDGPRSHDDTDLTELERRVLVFDGAIGTSIQARRLTPADFGGPGLEGPQRSRAALQAARRPD